MVEGPPKNFADKVSQFFESIGIIALIIVSAPFAIPSIIRGWRDDAKNPPIQDNDLHYQ